MLWQANTSSNSPKQIDTQYQQKNKRSVKYEQF